MTIAAILAEKGHEVATIAADCLIADLVAELVVRRIGALLVVDGDEIVGLASERDVIRALAADGDSTLSRPVRDVMTAAVVTISPGDSVTVAMALMTDRRIRHLPVVDEGRLVGMVSIGDLVKRRIAQAEQEAEALKHYISAA
jgi:CBS domain-containing protein